MELGQLNPTVAIRGPHHRNLGVTSDQGSGDQGGFHRFVNGDHHTLRCWFRADELQGSRLADIIKQPLPGSQYERVNHEYVYVNLLLNTSEVTQLARLWGRLGGRKTRYRLESGTTTPRLFFQNRPEFGRRDNRSLLKHRVVVR